MPQILQPATLKEFVLVWPTQPKPPILLIVDIWYSFWEGCWKMCGRGGGGNCHQDGLSGPRIGFLQTKPDVLWNRMVSFYSILRGLMWQVICLSSSPDYLLDLKFCTKIKKFSLQFSGHNLRPRAISPDLRNSPRVTSAIPRFILVPLSLSRKYWAAIRTWKSYQFCH